MSRGSKARAGAIDFEIGSGVPIVAFFPWGGVLNSAYGVVYDESDVIAQPLEVRREAWRYREVPGELLCWGEVVPFGGHFYMGYFGC